MLILGVFSLAGAADLVRAPERLIPKPEPVALVTAGAGFVFDGQLAKMSGAAPSDSPSASPGRMAPWLIRALTGR